MDFLNAFVSVEEALETSRKQLEDYEDALSQRESLIKELHAEAEMHHHQLGLLTQLQSELCSAREMSEVRTVIRRYTEALLLNVLSTSATPLTPSRAEVCSFSQFLQAENDLARDQTEESERLLRGHVQSLRERD